MTVNPMSDQMSAIIVIKRNIIREIASPRRRSKVVTSRNRHNKKSREGDSSEDNWDVEAACAIMTTKKE
jgi:hypothetical protein